MTEETHRKWDVISKIIITPITLLVKLFWGIYQYNASKEDFIDKEQRIKEQELIRKKEELYNETVSIVSKTANGDQGQPQNYKTNIDKFWELYWGKLASVESIEVESLMVGFGNALHSYQDGSGTLPVLKKHSLLLARRTRFEIDSLNKMLLKER